MAGGFQGDQAIVDRAAEHTRLGERGEQHPVVGIGQAKGASAKRLPSTSTAADAGAPRPPG